MPRQGQSSSPPPRGRGGSDSRAPGSPPERLAALAVALVLLALTCPSKIAVAGSDAVFFRRHCLPCHAIGGGRVIGPDLRHVLERQDAAWLVNFMLHPKRVLDSRDPYALELRAQAEGAVMPRIPALSAERALRLLELIEEESRLEVSQFARLELGRGPFSIAEIELGHGLFVGLRRLEHRAPPCLSCHRVRESTPLGGGTLGPDLTRAYERHQGRQGLGGWLRSPVTPAMWAVFGKKPLNNGEVRALVAYLEHTTAESAVEAERPHELAFLLLGLVPALLGLLGAALLWRRRPHREEE